MDKRPHIAIYSQGELGRNLAEQAKARRIALGLRQADLAEAAGVPLRTVRRFEQGRNVGLDVFLKITLALRVDRAVLDIFTLPPAGTIDDILRRNRQRERARPRA